MKSTGIIRKVDELGRVVLPVEMRRVLDIEERDAVEISMEDDKIVLRKHENSCVFCGSVEDLKPFKGKDICGTCVQNLKSE